VMGGIGAIVGATFGLNSSPPYPLEVRLRF
jgi:hypothetical protein